MREKLYEGLGNLEPLFKRFYSGRLRVLAYHKVPNEGIFNEQVKYLKTNYDLISIEQLLAHLEENEPLPKNPLLVTFDDGDISVYEKGLAVLEKYQVPACLFIITGLINSSRDVWIKRVEAKEMSDGKTYRQARETVKRMKGLSNKDRLIKMKNFPDVNARQMTSAQLMELQKNEVYIANHTHTHPMLDKCSAEEVKEEILLAKEVIQDMGFQGYDVFAYPNGNVDTAAEEVLVELGIKLVFLFDHKINPKNINPLRISRIKVDADTELNEFKAKVSGVHPFFFGIKNNLQN